MDMVFTSMKFVKHLCLESVNVFFDKFRTEDGKDRFENIGDGIA